MPNNQLCEIIVLLDRSGSMVTVRVLFLVITDGEENSSREFTKPQIKKMVEHQADAYQWAFSYLGANVDAFAKAGGMGIPAASSSDYAPTPTGVASAFAAVSDSAVQFRGAPVGAALELTDEQRAKMGRLRPKGAA